MQLKESDWLEENKTCRNYHSSHFCRLLLWERPILCPYLPICDPNERLNAATSCSHGHNGFVCWSVIKFGYNFWIWNRRLLISLHGCKENVYFKSQLEAWLRHSYGISVCSIDVLQFRELKTGSESSNYVFEFTVSTDCCGTASVST